MTTCQLAALRSCYCPLWVSPSRLAVDHRHETSRLPLAKRIYPAPYGRTDGVVVDIGGGTTGLAILKDGKVVQIEDEPTGGTHVTLVLAGNYHIPFAEAEQIKQDYKRHREILPVVRPVVEKMASIVGRYINRDEIDTIYLCGGTCCLTGIEQIFEKQTGIRTIKPADPFLVTPAGIAMNCKI